MKRIRRIEVIRYSRRSTLIGNEVTLEPALDLEQIANDVLACIPCTIETSVEEAGDRESLKNSAQEDYSK